MTVIKEPSGILKTHSTYEIRSQSSKKVRTRIAVRHASLVIFAGLMLYPLLWMVVSSFKPSNLILSQTGLIPSEVTTSNYTDGWDALGTPFTLFLINSGIIAVGSILGNLFL